MHMENSQEIITIAAVGNNRELGLHNGLLWDLPSDLQRFRDVTKGHPVIMGDRTYESLPFKPLPKRTNIVMTLDEDLSYEGAIMAHSPEEALALAKEADGSDKIFIMGGGMIYTIMLPYTDTLMLTLVDDAPEADVFFPEYADEFTEIVEKEDHEENGIAFSFTTLKRA
jgi:dihydrofolate reductase